jgi:hypothetical protein
MAEDENYAGHGEENHPEAQAIQQVNSPTPIWLWRFHFFGERSRQNARMEFPLQRLAAGPVVVRDTRPTSGRIIALMYNFSCSISTTFVAFLASSVQKVGVLLGFGFWEVAEAHSQR